MGQTLTNGIFLPNEGERNCYEGLAGNWRAIDGYIGDYNVHVADAVIHVSQEDRDKWDAVTSKADASSLTAHTGNTTIHVTAEDKAKWDAVTSKADASALTAHTGDTTIHVTAADKQAWNDHVADSVKHVTAADKAKWDAVTSKADDSEVLHKTGNETISGNKTFSSINGVEPSSLSLPSGNASDFIDISSYISALDGTNNPYTAPANGWVTIAVGNCTTISCIITGYWSDNRIRTTSGNLRMMFPILKNQVVKIQVIGGTIDYARFIPCQGNV